MKAFRSSANGHLFVKRQLSSKSKQRRVVVTGLGAVCCLGNDLDTIWTRVIDGTSGIKELKDPAFQEQNIPCRIAGLVELNELEVQKHIGKPIPKYMSRATQFGVIAAGQALAQSNWHPKEEADQVRSGVAMGMGMVDLSEISNTIEMMKSKGFRGVNPYFIPRILVNMAAGSISLKYNLKGPNHAVSTACATGAHAIGDAARFIQNGDADVMLCGGTEASVDVLGIAGFSRMRALATSYNDDPTKASRPFDRDREGFVMAEGAAALVLEELEHARNRDAQILAEVCGYGVSADAHHITAPCDDGAGAERSMTSAMRDAGVDKHIVGYINAHATSTPLGDIAECRAIRNVFGAHSDVIVSSSKGAVGHLLGAAGAIEAALTVMALKTAQIPPTANLENPDPACDGVILARGSPIVWDTQQRPFALSNSFGFGGTNASLVFSRCCNK